MADEKTTPAGQDRQPAPNGEAGEVPSGDGKGRISAEQARQLMKAHFATIAQRAGEARRNGAVAHAAPNGPSRQAGDHHGPKRQ